MSCELLVMDARNWLKKQKNHSVPNFVTGICDLNEIKDSLKGDKMQSYLKFFKGVVNSIFQKLDPNGYAIFIQTDRKYNRSWVDKSFIISEIAAKHGLKMIWHKIVLHQAVDSTDLYRPTYAHMLCYSRNGTTGAATPDVIPVSKRSYANATPTRAVEVAVEFVKHYRKKDSLIVDPFVGRGTVCQIATKHGVDSIGIDLDPKQIALAKKTIK